jgi:hypothetical protein
MAEHEALGCTVSSFPELEERGTTNAFDADVAPSLDSTQCSTG